MEAAGAWFVLFKKNSAITGVSYAEAVEEALCFGWIDSKPNTIDAKRFKLYFSPRKPKSVWSKPNKARVARLIREGRMTAAGLNTIRLAKMNGSWSALNNVDRQVIPAGLKKALGANATARKHFEAFPPSSKKIIIFWINSAKKSETRSQRVAETVRLAAKGERANHYRQPKHSKIRA